MFTHTSPLDVEIVLPVYNEERVLAASVYRLHDYLSRSLPYSWQITIADNASTDLTPDIARALANELDQVRALRLEQKGRGRALRAAWSGSRAQVVAYMDVDLSTDLNAVLPLIAPLVSGHSAVSIGTRLAPESRVLRGAKREVISRSYNRILHTALRARFSDAQCGFKALRRDVLPALLAAVQDDGWFFDTELLIAAQRQGLRIHEVPVDWVEDPDSRVNIVATALTDLRGVARLAMALPVGGPPSRRCDRTLPRRLARSSPQLRSVTNPGPLCVSTSTSEVTCQLRIDTYQALGIASLLVKTALVALSVACLRWNRTRPPIGNAAATWGSGRSAPRPKPRAGVGAPHALG